MRLYSGAYLDESGIKKALHMQVLARLHPIKITYPEGWIPHTPLDKLIARNLIIDMSIENIIKKFPNFRVSFVIKVKEN